MKYKSNQIKSNLTTPYVCQQQHKYLPDCPENVGFFKAAKKCSIVKIRVFFFYSVVAFTASEITAGAFFQEGAGLDARAKYHALTSRRWCCQVCKLKGWLLTKLMKKNLKCEKLWLMFWHIFVWLNKHPNSQCLVSLTPRCFVQDVAPPLPSGGAPYCSSASTAASIVPQSTTVLTVVLQLLTVPPSCAYCAAAVTASRGLEDGLGRWVFALVCLLEAAVWTARRWCLWIIMSLQKPSSLISEILDWFSRNILFISQSDESKNNSSQN